jgi:hypothetical protein
MQVPIRENVNGKAVYKLIEGNTTRWTWKEVDAIVGGKKVKVWRGGPR